jgi:hypothetical protein
VMTGAERLENCLRHSEAKVHSAIVRRARLWRFVDCETNGRVGG